MGTISLPNTFSSSTTISSSEVNANFSTLYNELNGSVETANLAASAVEVGNIADGAVTTAKIADDAVVDAKRPRSPAAIAQSYDGITFPVTTWTVGSLGDTPPYDPNGWVDTDNDRITVSESGLYLITGGWVTGTAPGNQTAIFTLLRVNNESLSGWSEWRSSYAREYTAVSARHIPQTKAVRYLTAGDYVELMGYSTVAISFYRTHLSVVKIGE